MKTISYKSLFAAFALTLCCSCSGGNNGSDAHQKSEHNHTEGETDEVEITQRQIETVGITLGHIGKKQLSDVIHATGELAVNPQDQAVASPLLPGIVTRICVRQGDYVRAGSPVAYVENTEIVTLQQDYLTAVDEKGLIEQEYNRQKALAEQGAGVRKNYEQAQTSMKVVTTRCDGLGRRLSQLGISPRQVESGNISTEIAVKADISGVVSDVMVKTGSFADMQTPVVSIIDNNAVYCNLRIFEKDLAHIAIGQSVEISLTNRTGSEIIGKISEITRAIDPATKSISVRVSVSDPTPDMLPGMAVTALISTGDEDVDALPDDAVVTSGGKSYIFVLEDRHEENGETACHFKRTEVITGAREHGFTQITPISPLETNATVVTSNAFYLNSMASDHGEHSH